MAGLSVAGAAVLLVLGSLADSVSGQSSSMPTLAGATVPTMVVPDTSKAPYQQKSSLPEGTLFIVVGAILGAVACIVLLCRLFLAWALHRSVERASTMPYANMPEKSGGGLVMSGVAGIGHHSTNTLPVSTDALYQPTHSANSLPLPLKAPTQPFFSPTKLGSRGVQSASQSRVGLVSGDYSEQSLPPGHYQPAGTVVGHSGYPTSHLSGGY